MTAEGSAGGSGSDDGERGTAEGCGVKTPGGGGKEEEARAGVLGVIGVAGVPCKEKSAIGDTGVEGVIGGRGVGAGVDGGKAGGGNGAGTGAGAGAGMAAMVTTGGSSNHSPLHERRLAGGIDTEHVV
jgi:hypothetical protein